MKLNWTAPTDAKWVAAGGSLKVSEPEDALVLLQASSFVLQHDLVEEEEEDEEGEKDAEDRKRKKIASAV